MKQFDKSIITDFRHGIALALLALFAIFFFWSNLERLEYGLYDLGSRLRVKPASSAVSIIAIDDRSIADFGPWPWPRSYIAFMIDMLDAYGAKVIGLDLIYAGKDMNHGLREVTNIIKTIENNPQYSRKNMSTIVLLSALKDAEQRLDNDAIMANSIATSKKVLLPVLFDLENQKKNAAVISLPDYLAANSIFPYPPDNSIAASAISVPIEPFAREASRLGHINIIPERDNVVRAERLFIRYQNRIFPSFALQAALAYLNMDLTDINFGKTMDLGAKKIPLISDNMHIAFKRDIPYYEFIDVINKKIPAESFRDKIVIIAPSTAALGELQETPVAYNVPSVKITANVIDNILSDDYIVRPDWAAALELAMIFCFGLYIALIIPRLSAFAGGAITLVVITSWIGASLYLFAAYGYWIKAVYPAFVLLMGFIIIVSKRYEVAPKT